MKITGELGEYDVRWCSYGWSYATAFIKRRKKLKFLPIYYTERIKLPTAGFPQCLATAKTMTYREMVEWFEECVSEYERIKKSWAEQGIEWEGETL